MNDRFARCARSLLCLVAVVLALQAVAGQQQSQLPQFKTATTVVPVDVRVTSSNGKPITDLKASDFVVREDGVPQAVKIFIPISFGSEASLSRELPADPMRPAGFVTPSGRVFLIVLARGRLTGPSNELDALSRFLRERLLPADHVALLAYNRATAFTTDHPKLVQVLERYRAVHESIEADITSWFSGLRAMFVSKTIPEFIQQRIDAIFSGVSGLPSRDMRPRQPKGASSADLARALDKPPTIDEEDPARSVAATNMWTNVGALDKYMEKVFQTTHDIGSLLKGIDYMRSIEGEKHLVLITPSRLMLPGLDGDRSLATAASDSRVAVDIIYTGGVAAAPIPTKDGDSALTGEFFREGFAAVSMREFSQLTGGQSTAFRSGEYAFDRLDLATRFEYLLGYYPQKPWDGSLRRVTVEVKRKDVTVSYRRSYVARPASTPLDRRPFLTEARMGWAALFDGSLNDIKVRLLSPEVVREGGRREFTVNLEITPSELTVFRREGDRYVAQIELNVMCGDSDQKVVGAWRQTMTLRVRAEGFERLRTQPVTVPVRVPLKSDPVLVKAVVYEYESDTLGTASLNVKGR